MDIPNIRVNWDGNGVSLAFDNDCKDIVLNMYQEIEPILRDYPFALLRPYTIGVMQNEVNICLQSLVMKGYLVRDVLGWHYYKPEIFD